jgi:hypothetical protein
MERSWPSEHSHRALLYLQCLNLALTGGAGRLRKFSAGDPRRLSVSACYEHRRDNRSIHGRHASVVSDAMKGENQMRRAERGVRRASTSLTRHSTTISPLRTDSRQLVSKIYWRQSANSAIMREPEWCEPTGLFGLYPRKREYLGGCESADHPKLPVQPRVCCVRITCLVPAPPA